MRQEVYVKFAGTIRKGRAAKAVASHCTVARIGDVTCNGELP